MTEADAHKQLIACRRWWVGNNPISEDEAIKKIKSSCLVMLAMSIMPLGNELPRLIYPPDESLMFYGRLIIVFLAVFLAVTPICTLMRIWRICRTLGKEF